MDERVIEHAVSLLQRFHNNAVVGEKFEIDACGSAESSRVDAESTKVTYDEPQRFASG